MICFLPTLKTREDLTKILAIRDTVQEQAYQEYLACSTTPEGNPLEPPRVVTNCKRLLRKYANYPTFSEFSVSPSLANGTQWGATLGVPILISCLILAPVETQFPNLVPAIRPTFLSTLNELGSPKNPYVSGAAEKALSQTKISPLLIQEIVKALLVASDHYAIIITKEAGVVLTPLGLRILLHLKDAQEFTVQISRLMGRLK
jgi:hypothetical protein